LTPANQIKPGPQTDLKLLGYQTLSVGPIPKWTSRETGLSIYQAYYQVHGVLKQVEGFLTADFDKAHLLLCLVVCSSTQLDREGNQSDRGAGPGGGNVKASHSLDLVF
jgi:hypothetical protein